MMYLSNRGTLPQRLLYTLASSLLAGDTFAATGEQFALSDTSTQSDHCLVARLLNAAAVTTLPPWTRELMRQAAAEIGPPSGPPAPDQR